MDKLAYNYLKCKYDVFISYSRKDYQNENKEIIPNNFVSKIKEKLTKENINYWFDEENIDYGVDFTNKITTFISSSKIFIFLSSANANNPESFTVNEIAYAFREKKIIIPVRMDNSSYAPSVKFYINNYNHIDYYANPEKGIKDLINSIKKHLRQIEDQINETNEHIQQIINDIQKRNEILLQEETIIKNKRDILLLDLNKILDEKQRDSLKTYIICSSPIRSECFKELSKQHEELENNLKISIKNIDNLENLRDKDLKEIESLKISLSDFKKQIKLTKEKEYVLTGLVVLFNIILPLIIVLLLNEAIQENEKIWLYFFTLIYYLLLFLYYKVSNFSIKYFNTKLRNKS